MQPQLEKRRSDAASLLTQLPPGRRRAATRARRGETRSSPPAGAADWSEPRDRAVEVAADVADVRERDDDEGLTVEADEDWLHLLVRGLEAHADALLAEEAFYRQP